MNNPPLILQKFSANLLSAPGPTLRDTTEDLWRIYLYLQKRVEKKTKNLPKKRQYSHELIKEFISLYEQAKAKEKKLKGNTSHHTQRFFYFIKSLSPKDESLYRRLRHRH